MTADCVYGDDDHLRCFLTERDIPSVLAVHPPNQIRLGLWEGLASLRMDVWFARTHRGRWYRLSAGWGAKGPRWFDWAWRTMEAEVPDGWQAWGVARRSLSDPTEVVSYRVCAPKQTTLQQIVAVAGQRWRVEEAIERAKEACGLAQDEVRRWAGCYRHITLSLLAQVCATLMMEQANAEQGKKVWEPKPGPSSLQLFKSRRGLAGG